MFVTNPAHLAVSEAKGGETVLKSPQAETQPAPQKTANSLNPTDSYAANIAFPQPSHQSNAAHASAQPRQSQQRPNWICLVFKTCSTEKNHSRGRLLYLLGLPGISQK